MTPRALPTTGQVIALPMGRGRRPAEAQIVPIAETVSALTFDIGPDAPLSGRLTGEIDGAPLRGPLVSTTLALRSGGTRHVLLLGLGGRALLDRRITLSLGGQPAAAIEPDWLQSPLSDGGTLIEGLAEDGRRRLLKLFLTTGASLFGTGAAAAFARAAEGLLALLGLSAFAPACWCRLGAASVLSFAVPPGFDAASLGELVLLTRGRAQRLAGAKAVVERRKGAALLHLALSRPLPAGAALVATGPALMRLQAPTARTVAAPLGRWLAGRDAPTRAWAHALVEAAAATDPAAAALAREMRWLASAPPALDIAHLSGTPQGILYAVRLADPRGLVRGLRLERGGAAVELALPSRPGIATIGYARLPRTARSADSVRLRLIFHSGLGETLRAVPLPPHDGSLPPTAGPADARAIAMARLDREPAPTAAWIEPFGPPPRRIRLAVIADLGPDLDLVQARAALVAAAIGKATGKAGGAIMVCTVPEGPLAEAARGAIAQAAAVHGLPHRLVVTPRGTDAGARLVAALGHGPAPRTTLVVAADTLPDRGENLLASLRGLGTRRPVLCGIVTDHDGQPAHQPGLATAVALAPAAVAAIRDAGAVYPVPDVLVADAARRLNARPRPAGRFVRYAAPGGRSATETAVDAWALRLLAGEGEE